MPGRCLVASKMFDGLSEPSPSLSVALPSHPLLPAEERRTEKHETREMMPICRFSRRFVQRRALSLDEDKRHCLRVSEDGCQRILADVQTKTSQWNEFGQALLGIGQSAVSTINGHTSDGPSLLSSRSRRSICSLQTFGHVCHSGEELLWMEISVRDAEGEAR